MTFQSEQDAKKVEIAFGQLTQAARKVTFAEAELANAQEQLENKRKLVQRERELYDVHLEKCRELFPHVSVGFKPEPIHQTVAMGEDGLVHVVDQPEDEEKAS